MNETPKITAFEPIKTNDLNNKKQEDGLSRVN
jgi:hypothetical protein